MSRKAEAQYWIKLAENSSTPKDFWKVSNQILRKSTITRTGPLQGNDGNIIIDDEQKADLLNNSFLNTAINLTRNLDPFPFDTTCFINRVTPTIDNFSIAGDEIKNDVLKSLQPNKLVGPDQISPKDLRLAQDSVIQGLFEVFTKSKDCCRFPQQWKESLVTVIFTKGNKLDPNNYRPISLLSVPGKLLERVVCKSFDDHILSNSILTNKQ